MRTIIVLLIILIIVSFTVYYFLIQSPLKRQTNYWGIQINLAGFKKTGFSQDKSGTSESEELDASKEDLTVIITRTKTNDHKKYIEDRQFLLDSLFLPVTSPYPEVITDVIECPSEFKPKVENVQNGVIYTMFAGERLNFGICAKDLIKYSTAYGIFDCGKGGIFEIKAFDKIESTRAKSIVKSFSC